MIYTKFVPFLVLLSSLGVPLSPAAVEFESLLMATDCASVNANKAFDIRALARSFPIPKGFDFYGDESGRIAFREITETDPAVDARYRLDGKKSTASYPARGSILYSPKENDDQSIKDRIQLFESLQWNGTKLLFRSGFGGRIAQTTTYQLVVYSADSKYELIISVVEPQVAANIVACSVSTGN